VLVVDDLRLVPTPTRLTEVASPTTNGVGVLDKLLMGSTWRLRTRRGCLMGVKRGCEEVDAAVERKYSLHHHLAVWSVVLRYKMDCSVVQKGEICTKKVVYRRRLEYWLEGGKAGAF